MTNNSQFSVTHNKGFEMTFGNGLTISVQFGTGNYCDRRGLQASPLSEMREPIVQSANAEIAIWDADNAWFYFGSDYVKGWCTPDEVSRWIAAIQMSNNLDDLHTIATEAEMIEKPVNQD